MASLGLSTGRDDDRLNPVDGRAEGGTGIKDGVGAGLGDISREIGDAFLNGFGLGPRFGDVGAQGFLQQIVDARVGPQGGEGGTNGVDGAPHRVDDSDPGDA